MKDFLRVNCQNCHKKFWKDKNRVNENLKLGHCFYCSRKCQNESRTSGKIISCENTACKNKFYRAPHEILNHNYCSSSCAAIVNNQRYPKWPKRYCVACKKEFKNRGSKYCSNKCGWSVLKIYHLPKYTKDQIILKIQEATGKLGRVPAKRELKEVSDKCAGVFGSWNNAITAANLQPHRSHDHRMYRRIKIKAHDGHICDSISEAIIDNWLARHNISHTRDAKYPTTNHKADWAIGNSVFVEYFGLAKDSPRYDREIKLKKWLCKKNAIKLVEIYSKDLYPKILLDSRLSQFKQ